MGKKTIDAKEILADIRTGMDNSTLIQKYGLSENGLQNLFKKLLNAGALKPKQAKEARISSNPGKTDEHVWKCSQCGEPQAKSFDECCECPAMGLRIKSAQLMNPPQEITDEEMRERISKHRRSFSGRFWNLLRGN
jgi:hypothetical protein